MHDSPRDHELERLLERFESNRESRIFAPLADRYRKLNQLDEALEVCTEGLARHPDYSSAHVILAKIHLDREDVAAAESEFHRVLELDPENLLALRHLGRLHDDADRPVEALEYWRRLLELDPMHEEAQSRVEAAPVGPDVGTADGATDGEEAADAPPVHAETPEVSAGETSAEPPEAESPEAESPEAESPEAESPEVESVAGIATRTLADIYYEQGFKAKALTIYERMLEANRPVPRLREKIERIRTELAELETSRPAEVGDVKELEKAPAADEGVLSARFVDEPPSGASTGPGAEEASEEPSEEDFTHFKSWLERHQVKP